MGTSNESLVSAAKQSALTNFGYRLRNTRQNIGLTQQEVAARLKVSHPDHQKPGSRTL